MPRTFRVLRPLFGLVVALLALGLSACNKHKFPPVYPVKGKILVNGKPAADCIIYFNRTADDKNPKPVVPQGQANESGEFKMTSYVAEDGVPAGDYIVTFEWRERSGMMNNQFDGIDRLGGVYAKPEQTKGNKAFLVTIGKGPVELPPFELTQSAEAKRRHDEWKTRRKGPTIGSGD